MYWTLIAVFITSSGVTSQSFTYQEQDLCMASGKIITSSFNDHNHTAAVMCVPTQ